MDQQTREYVRWVILQTLHIAAPVGATESMLRSVVAAEVPCTEQQIRQQLDYLESRRLISITGRDTAKPWRAEIERYGVDLVEYTVACEPGIARPTR